MPVLSIDAFPVKSLKSSKPPTDPTSDVVLNMKDLAGGIFSDLTITCQGERFPVHKNILYIQSKYFRKLLGGDFKERNAKVIDLPDDEPSVLAVLIHFFYYFYLDLSKCPEDWSQSTFTVQVYSVADKYDVPKLRDLCVKHFSKTCNPLTNVAEFIDAIRAVNAYTVGSAGKPLWDIIKPRALANISLLCKQAEFRTLLLEPEFHDLNFELLAMGDPNGVQADEDDDAGSTTVEMGGESDLLDYTEPYGGHHYHGPGRRLG